MSVYGDLVSRQLAVDYPAVIRLPELYPDADAGCVDALESYVLAVYEYGLPRSLDNLSESHLQVYYRLAIHFVSGDDVGIRVREEYALACERVIHDRVM